MVSSENVALNSAFRSFPFERESNLKAIILNADGPKKEYHRATLRNPYTGLREEIELFDINDETNEDLLAQDFRLELKADLKAALVTFSPLEQRIIFRVLVQGQSVREATKRMKSSSRTWERWLSEEALPRLRKLLEDYQEDGKVVL